MRLYADAAGCTAIAVEADVGARVPESFSDHFSAGAAEYAAFRPRYPDPLFAWLAERTSGHDLAWDCATGNGQAALGVAAHYARVVATDASAQQIEQAEAHPRVEYRVALAQESGLPDAAADAVTVAQALHWLPHEAFFSEVRRVLAPGGLFFAWAYDLVSTGSASLDRELHRFYSEIVGPYWPPERRYVDAHYLTVPFPFEEIAVPSFSIEQAVSRRWLEGYLRTWSASRRYRAAHGGDPVDQIAPALDRDWPDPHEIRRVHWPVFGRAGRGA